MQTLLGPNLYHSLQHKILTSYSTLYVKKSHSAESHRYLYAISNLQLQISLKHLPPTFTLRAASTGTRPWVDVASSDPSGSRPGVFDIQLLLVSFLVNRWWTGERFSHVFPMFSPFLCAFHPGWKLLPCLFWQVLRVAPCQESLWKMMVGSWKTTFFFGKVTFFWGHLEFLGCKRKGASIPICQLLFLIFRSRTKVSGVPQTKREDVSLHWTSDCEFLSECDDETPRNDLFGELVSSDGVLVKKRHVTPKGHRQEVGFMMQCFKFGALIFCSYSESPVPGCLKEEPSS